MPKLSSAEAKRLADLSHAARRRNKVLAQAHPWTLPEKAPIPTPGPEHAEPLPQPFIEQVPTVRRWRKGFEPNLGGPPLAGISLSLDPTTQQVKVVPTDTPRIPVQAGNPWVTLNKPPAPVTPETQPGFTYHPPMPAPKVRRGASD